MSEPQAIAASQEAPHIQTMPIEAALNRLAALHDEAAETTRLANLLGRTPWVVGLLCAGAFAAIGVFAGFTLDAPAATWLILALAGPAVMLSLYRRALRAPFNLGSLRVFHAELKAALLYAGVAWGAGMFFLGPQDNLLEVIAFSAGMTAAVEIAFRAPNSALWFAAAAALLPAAAAALTAPGLAYAGMIFAAGLGVIAAADTIARLAAPREDALITVS
jgi:hypothetical protein